MQNKFINSWVRPRNLLILIEGIAIIFGIFYLYSLKKGGNVLGSTSVMPLQKDDYQATVSGGLKYFFEPMPNTLVTQSSINWLKKKVVYTFNSDTLNERYDYTTEKPEHTFRILAIGDSHTYGAYVNPPDNYPELLEDKLNTLKCNNISKFEVINLGIGGYGPEYIKERYRVRGIKYNPDLIIWYESGAGFGKVNEILTPILREYQGKMTQEEIKQDLDKGNYTAWENAEKEMMQRYTYDQLNQMVANSWKEFYLLRGGTKVLVIAHESLNTDQKNNLIDWANGQSNVSFFLGLPNYNTKIDRFPDGHPNEDGYKTIVKSLLDYLKKDLLSNCE
jgi:lysophospholipase L1-like esterase